MDSEFKAKTDELLVSIQHQVDWLNEVKNEINAGTYTTSKAWQDHNDAMFNEGFDWMSLLMDIAEMEGE